MSEKQWPWPIPSARWQNRDFWLPLHCGLTNIYFSSPHRDGHLWSIFLPFPSFIKYLGLETVVRLNSLANSKSSMRWSDIGFVHIDRSLSQIGVLRNITESVWHRPNMCVIICHGPPRHTSMLFWSVQDTIWKDWKKANIHRIKLANRQVRETKWTSRSLPYLPAQTSKWKLNA